MKWLAIINPISGKNKNLAQRQKLVEELHAVVTACEFTQYSGHARELARAAFTFDGIAVVGGDGTLFEVVSGMELPRQHLALVPSGTGNSLARDLELRNSADGIAALRTTTFTRIDLLRITFTRANGSTHQRYAATTIGLGYPAHVTQTGNQRCKRLGHWCYPVAATLETFAPQSMSVHIGYQGKTSEWQRLTGLLINNTQHSGNFKAFPQAGLDDGVFDVMEMNAGWFGQNLHNLSVLSQMHRYKPAKISQTTAINIHLKHPQILMIDGEIVAAVISLHVHIVPKAVACCRAKG